jgi:UDP-2-acetamido-3-amino-2,3-dideoxy-glucuronate N-acetyltransferase
LSFEEVLQDETVLAIVIATPARSHHEMAKLCIAAGKHVFIEKPLALSLKDGEDLKRMSEQRGTVLMVGHLLQYHPAYRRLRELVSAGSVGSLRYVYSNRLSLGKIRTDENVLWSFAPHDISMILGVAGGELPSLIDAHGSAVLSPSLSDSAHLHLSFASGLRAHVFTSWVHPFKEHRFIAIGDQGCLVFDDTRPHGEKLLRTSHLLRGGVIEKGESVFIETEGGEPLRLECEHFLQAIEGSIVPLTGADEALKVLRVLNAADNSLIESRL